MRTLDLTLVIVDAAPHLLVVSRLCPVLPRTRDAIGGNVIDVLPGTVRAQGQCMLGPFEYPDEYAARKRKKRSDGDRKKGRTTSFIVSLRIILENKTNETRSGFVKI